MSPKDAHAERTFSIAYENTLRGNITRIANSVMTCDRSRSPNNRCNRVESTTGLPRYTNNAGYNGAGSSDVWTSWIDIDGNVDIDGINNGDDTYNSSAATLSLPPTAVVEWAGLYWSGNTSDTGDTNDPNQTHTQMRFLTPGGSYALITADWCDFESTHYTCFKDMSLVVQMAGAGEYIGANIKANTGGRSHHGGWELSVVYQDNTEPIRNITIYHGHREYGGGSANSETLVFNGFLAPFNGPVDARMGVSLNDGDATNNDSLLFQSESDATPTTLSNDLNPENDLGNSTITIPNGNAPGSVHVSTRRPAHRNTLGLDVDVFAVDVQNGDTSATMTFGAVSGEVNYFYKVDFAIDIYSPELTTTKSVVDLNGSDVVPGDVLEYTITVANEPTSFDDAVSVRITDVIPTGSTYVPNSMEIVSTVAGGPPVGALTDANDMTDVGTFGVFTPNAVTISIGSGATHTTGGELAIGQSTSVRFRVTIDPTTTPFSLSNEAVVTYEGETIQSSGGTVIETSQSDDPTTGGPDDPTDVPVGPDPDGDGKSGDGDIDADNDGITNIEEGQGIDPELDDDNDDISNWADADTNGFLDANSDGVDDRFDQDLDGIPNHLDLDSDGDSISDFLEAGGDPVLDANNDGRIDSTADVNDNGLIDAVDPGVSGGVALPITNTDMTDLPDFLDTDDDNDSILTLTEASDGTTHGINPDGDTLPNWRDTESDGDMILDEDETQDIDVDGVPDYLDDDINFIAVPAHNARLSDTTPSINGTTEPSATLTLVLRDSSNTIVATLNTTAHATTGAWEVSPMSALVDGTYTVVASAQDSTAKTGVDTITFTVDTMGPDTTITQPLEGSIAGATAAITGTTTEPNATVEVFVDGSSIGTTTSNTLGVWSLTPMAPIAQGPRIIRAIARDDLGNFGQDDTVNVTIDATAPTVTITSPADNTRTNDATPTLTGATEPNATLEVRIDGAIITSLVANGAGNFSFTPPMNLADGPYVFRFTPTDAVGNVGAPVDWNLTIDTTGPDVTISQPADNAITMANPPITGTTTEAGATVEVFVDGLSQGTTTANAAGAWSITLGNDLSNGPHTIRATARDALGNTGSPDSVNITVDASEPTVTITSPADNTRTNDATPTLTGVTEPNATLEVRIDKITVRTITANASGNFSFAPLLPLTNGPHVFTFTPTDIVGNVGAPVDWNLTIDTMGPDVVIATPTENATVSSTPTIAGTTEPGATVEVFVGSTSIGTTMADPMGSWTISPGTPLSTGMSTLRAIASDDLGNTGNDDTVNIIVDATIPTVSITSPANNTHTTETKPTLTGITEPGATVEVQVDGVIVSTVTADAQGDFSFTSSNTLTDGPHVFTFTPTDSGSNMGTPVNWTLIVDTTGPDVLITQPTNNATVGVTPDITGTTEPGATVEVFIDTTLIGTTTADNNGIWALTTPTPLQGGLHTIRASAQDDLGNSGTDDSVAVLIDNTLPTLVVSAPHNNTRLNNATPTLTGTTEPNATVEVRIDGIVVGTSTADALGVFAFTPPGALVDGDRLFTFTPTDTIGNVGSAVDWNLTIDTTGPTTTITNPVDGSNIGNARPTVTGRASEGNSTIEVLIDGVSVGNTTTDAQGDWSLALANNLSDDAHTFIARPTDDLGNLGQDTASSVTIDSSLPSVDITSPTNGASTSLTSPPVTGITDPGASVQVVFDAGTPDAQTVHVTAMPDGSWSVTPTTPLDDGEHTITATATDMLNVVSAPVSIGFTIDTMRPVVTIIEPVTNTTLTDSTPTITGTTSEGDALIELSVDGIVLGSTRANSTGQWSFTPQATDPIASGAHVITATATDDAGNVSVPDSVNVTINSDKPIIAIVTPTNNSTTSAAPTISGTTDQSNKAVIIIIDQGTPSELLLATATDTQGNWSIMAPVLTEGDHSIIATVRDEHGNEGVDTVDFSVAGAHISILQPAHESTVSNTQPGLAGKADPGATVTLTIDKNSANAQTLTRVANANGDWFAFPTQPLAEGTHTLEATTDDGFGGMATANVSFDVNLTAPTISITTPMDGTSTSDDTPEIAGTSSPGATVFVSIDNATPVDVTANDQGVWTYQTTIALTPGAHLVRALTRDASGLESSANSSFIVDLSVPSITIDTPADMSVTGDTTPVVRGTTEPNASVAIVINNVLMGTVTADDFGFWSFPITTPLSESTHTIEATATDASGLTSPTEQVSFTVDTTAPYVTIDDPMDGSSISDDTPALVGTSAPGATVLVSIDGATPVDVVTNAQGTWTLQVNAPLTQGAHSANAETTLGNDTAQASSDFELDTQPPALAVLTPADRSTIREAQPVISGTSDPGAVITITLPTGEVLTTTTNTQGEWSAIPSQPLMEGDVLIDVLAKDEAGNETPGDATITLDLTPPDVDITNPDPRATKNDAEAPIRGKTEPHLEVVVYLDGAEIGKATADDQGYWTLQPKDPITDGVHTLHVDATDEAGNTGSDTIEFIIDTRAPSITITSPTQDAVLQDTTPSILGSATPDALVDVFIDGLLVGMTTTDAAGAWALTLTDAQALSIGAHTVFAQTRDMQGTLVNDEVDFVIDDGTMQGPMIAILSPVDGEDTNDPTPTITGTADPLATVEIFVDDVKVGETIAGDDGAWTFELPEEDALSTGDHTIMATVTDEGITNEAGPITITLDTMPPEGEINSPSTGDTITPTPTVTGTGEPDADVIIYVDEKEVGRTKIGEDGTWEFPIPAETPINEGDHTISVDLVDPAGNTSSLGPIEVTVDHRANFNGLELIGGGCSCSSTTTPDAPPAMPFLLLLAGVAIRRKKPGKPGKTGKTNA